MPNVVYYNHTIPSPDQQPEYLSTLSSYVAGLITGSLPIGTKLLAQWVVGSVVDFGVGTTIENVYLSITIEEGNQFTLAVENEQGDLVHQISNDNDGFLFSINDVLSGGLSSTTTTALTLGFAIVAGVALTNIALMAAIGTGASAIFSRYQGPEAVDSLIDTLLGTRDVVLELKDINGVVVSSAVYEDGLTDAEFPQAVRDFLLISGEKSISDVDLIGDNFTIPKDGMKIEVTRLGSANPQVLETYTIYTHENPDGTVTSAIAERAADVFFGGDFAAFKAQGDGARTNGDILSEKIITDESDPQNPVDQYHSWIFARDDVYDIVDGVDTELFGRFKDVVFIPTPNEDAAYVEFHPQYIWVSENGSFNNASDDSHGLYLGDDMDSISIGVHAGSGDDWMFGEGGIDILYGDAGRDHVFGGSGDDILYASGLSYGLEGDVYHGGSEFISIGSDGIDTLDYSLVNASLVLELRSNDSASLAGDKTIAYQVDASGYQVGLVDHIYSIERFVLGAGKDVVRVTDQIEGVEYLNGSGGRDILDFSEYGSGVTIDVNAGDAHQLTFVNFTNFIGSDHEDEFIDAAGVHVYDGGDDLDEIDYSNATFHITANMDKGTVTGAGFETDIITNIEGITGTDYNDTFIAKEGVVNAYYDGGANEGRVFGSVTVDGRDKIDFSHYTLLAEGETGPVSPASDGLTITLGDFGTGSGTDASGGSFALVSIEEIIGTFGSDDITTGDGSNWIYGGVGNDVISTGAGDDYLFGGAGNNILLGGTGNDTYFIGEGFDTISDTGGTNDVLSFLEGYAFNPSAFVRGSVNDNIGILGVFDVTDAGDIELVKYVDGATFQMDGLGLTFSQDVLGTGGITFTGAEFVDADMDGQPDEPINDSQSGSSYDDELNGEDGNDILSGGSGNDLLRGGAGSDTLSGGEGNDALYAESGSSSDTADIDILDGGDGNDFLFGSAGADILHGGEGYDYLYGYGGNTLYGEEGEDRLFGSDNVILDGGIGNDYLSASGDGAVYIVSAGNDVINNSATNAVLRFDESNLSYYKAANGSLVIEKQNSELVIVQDFWGAGSIEFFEINEILYTASSVIGNEIEFYGNVGEPNTAQEFSGGDEDNYYISTGYDDTVIGGLGANTYQFNVGYAGSTDPSRVYLFAEVDEENDIIKLPYVNSLSDMQLVYKNGEMVIEVGDTELVIEDALSDGQSEHIVVQIGTGLSGQKTLLELDPIIYAREIEYGDLSGYSVNDEIYAHQNGSVIHGLIGNDVIYSGIGDDIIYGDQGADVLVDSDGDDTYYVDFSDTLLLGGGNNTLILDTQVQATNTLSGLKLLIDDESSFDNLQFAREFVENGVLTDVTYSLVYGGGKILIDDYGSLFQTVTDGSPTVVLVDTAQSQKLSNFTVVTDDTSANEGRNFDEFDDVGLQTHNDLYYGSAYDDDINFSSGIDVVYGGDGNDHIFKFVSSEIGGTHTIEAYGEGGDDFLIGGIGDDILDGGAGQDRIYTGQGADQVFGGADNDSIFIEGQFGTNSFIDGGDGIDELSLFRDESFTDQSVYSQNVEINMLAGSVISEYGFIYFSNIENINGTYLNDVITGDEGDNRINANKGNDIINGGAGDDTYVVSGTFSTYQGQNFGIKTISDTGGDLDVVEITSLNNQSSLTGLIEITEVGLDLHITIFNTTMILENQLGADDSLKVENLLLSGNPYDLGDDVYLDLVNYTSWYVPPEPVDPAVLAGTAAAEAHTGAAETNDTVDYSAAPGSVRVDLAGNEGRDSYAEGDTYVSIENIIGSDISSQGDTLSGNADANKLYGLDGADSLEGHEGDDLLFGGLGNDSYLHAIGDGNDEILEEGGQDSIVVYTETSLAVSFSQSGNDLLIDLGDIITVKDFYSGSAENIVETLIILNPNAPPEIHDLTQLSVVNQDDVFVATLVAETHDGGNGNDTVDYSNSDAGIIIDLLNNTASGGFAEGDAFSSIENIIGTNYNDTITGTDGDNILSGGAGNDNLIGGLGNDEYIFSSGNYSIVDAGGTNDILTISSLTSSEAVLDGRFKLIRYYDNPYNLVVRIDDANTLDDVYLGTVTIINQVYPFVTDYQIEAVKFSDTAIGQEVPFTDLGVITLGGENSDTIFGIGTGANPNDTIYGQNDLGDEIYAGAGSDMVYGGLGADKLYGQEDNDALFGGQDNDILDGGDGNDIIYGDYSQTEESNSYTGNDEIHGGNGNDWLEGNAGSDTIYGEADNDVIIGGQDIDYLYGGSGDDKIWGGSENDEIRGGLGSDLIYGQSGADDLYGDEGDDIFAWYSSDLNAVDKIHDFSIAEDDVLDISDILTGYTEGTSDITEFVQITDDGTDSTLAVDADGGGDNFVTIATLYGAVNLDEATLLASGNLIAA